MSRQSSECGQRHSRTLRALLIVLAVSGCTYGGQIGNLEPGVEARVERNAVVVAFPWSVPDTGAAATTADYSWVFGTGSLPDRTVGFFVWRVAAGATPPSDARLLEAGTLSQCDASAGHFQACATRVAGRAFRSGDRLIVRVTEPGVVAAYQAQRPAQMWRQITTPSGAYSDVVTISYLASSGDAAYLHGVNAIR